MDTIWAFREGYENTKPSSKKLYRLIPRYEKARKIKDSQDQYCAKALSNQWKDLGDFPEDLQWEALVDVLRGRVKVQLYSCSVQLFDQS